MPTVAFKTLGCKLNQYETEVVRMGLEDAGFDTDPVPEGAVQKQKEQPAAPKEKQPPDLYQ